MLNLIWGGMILVGVVCAAFLGNMGAVNTALIDGTKEAVSLCIFMYGVVGMWTGIMQIAESCGLLKQLSKVLMPMIRWMFPGIPKEHKANEYIATNIAANIFGLGWAATPSGLLAMKEMGELNEGRGVASHEMCMFLIVNISSLQLIPMNMIGYRSQYGSVHPSVILMPALIATTVSTIIGILYGKWKGRNGT